MGGEIKTDALDWVSEYLQIEDMELLIDGLLILQDFHKDK